MTQQAQLFETKDGRFGTQIGTNSEGAIVLEIRGANGEVAAFASDTLTEVTPYTVEIEFTNGQKHHFEVKKDSLQAGDVVVTGIHLGRVKNVDSKSKSAKKAKDLMKVGVTPL